MDGMRSVTSELHLEKHSMSGSSLANIPAVSFSGVPLPPTGEGGLAPDVLRNVFTFDPKVLSQFRQDLMSSWPQLGVQEGAMRSYQRETFDKGLPNEAPKKEIKEIKNEKREDLPKELETQNKETPEVKMESKSHSNSFISYMQDVQRSSKITDAVLVTQGGFVRTHCCLLACASPFLKKTLEGNADFPIMISVPDIAYPTLKNLIDCIYMESPPINTNLKKLIEAAKHLGMDSLIPVLTDALKQQKELRNKASLGELSADESEEKFGRMKNKKLDLILNQKFNHLPTDEKDLVSASNPYLPESTGILGELLTKNDFARTNFSYPSIETNRTNTPLNLSKGKTTNSIPPSKTTVQNSSYFSGLNSAAFHGFPISSNVFNELNPKSLNSFMNSTAYSSFPTLTTSSKLKTTSSASRNRTNKSYLKQNVPSSSSSQTSSTGNNKSKSSTGFNAAAAAAAASAPYLLKNNIFTKEILQELYDKVKSNPQLASISALNSLSGIPNLGAIPNIQRFQSLFPNLFQSSSSTNKIAKQEPQEILISSPQPSIMPLTSESVALNLSNPSCNAMKSSDHSPDSKSADRSSTPNAGDDSKRISNSEPLDFTLLAKTATSLPSSGATISSFHRNPLFCSSVDEAAAASVSSQAENCSLSSVLTPSANLLNSSVLLPSTSLLAGTSFDSHLDFSSGNPFGSLGLQFPLPSSLHLSSKYSLPPQISISDINCSNGPVDLSPGSNRKESIGHDDQISDSVASDIDVVGSPTQTHESFLSEHQNISKFSMRLPKMEKQLSPSFLHGDISTSLQQKDSKPATPDSIEVLEETSPAERIVVPQAPRKHLFQAGNMGRKRKGCGECDGCQVVEDCSQCRFCRDKAKFGGPNRLKQVCVYKRCIVLDSELDEGRKRRKVGLHRRKHARCGTCDGCKQTSDCNECYTCLHNANVQPATRKKVCEMRVCEQQQMEEVRASLNAAEEPSPYSTDSLIAEGVVLGAVSRTGSPNPDGSLLNKHKLKLTKKMTKKLNQSMSRVSPSKVVRTKYYCGECPGCQTTTPCGSCLYCEDMPKFGGPGRYRQKCVKQLCIYHPRLQALKLTNKPKVNLDERSGTPEVNLSSLAELDQASTIMGCTSTLERAVSKSKEPLTKPLPLTTSRDKAVVDVNGAASLSSVHYKDEIKTSCWNPYLMKGTESLSSCMGLPTSDQSSMMVPPPVTVLNPLSLTATSLFSPITTSYDSSSVRHSVAALSTPLISDQFSNVLYKNTGLSSNSYPSSSSSTSASNTPPFEMRHTILEPSCSPELDVHKRISTPIPSNVQTMTSLKEKLELEGSSSDCLSRDNLLANPTFQAATASVLNNAVTSTKLHVEHDSLDDVNDNDEPHIDVEEDSNPPTEIVNVDEPNDNGESSATSIDLDHPTESINSSVCQQEQVFSNDSNEAIDVEDSNDVIDIGEAINVGDSSEAVDIDGDKTDVEERSLILKINIPKVSISNDDSSPPIIVNTGVVRRGRGRGRGKGRGRGRKGGIVMGRKRGRRRKTPRFTIDPEDHSDYEDSLLFEDPEEPVSKFMKSEETEVAKNVPVPLNQTLNSSAADVYEFEDPPATNYSSSFGTRPIAPSNANILTATSNGTHYAGGIGLQNHCVGSSKPSSHFSETNDVPIMYESESFHKTSEKYSFPLETTAGNHEGISMKQRDVNENLDSSTA